MLELIVYLVGTSAALLLLVLAIHRLLPTHKQRARISPEGLQEVEVLVRGRFEPSTVIVRKGIPIRLLFNRQEDSPYSECVIFSAPRQERRLAPFATTAVLFTPSRPGEQLFTSSMGMYRGHLVVEER